MEVATGQGLRWLSPTTGGTTGLPKGAMLTHANLTAATSQHYETTRVEPPLLLEGVERTRARERILAFARELLVRRIDESCTGDDAV